MSDDRLEKMEELKDALEEARADGDPSAEAAALYQIGRMYFRERVWEAADDFWRQCESVCLSADREQERAQVLLDRGDVALATEDFDAAGRLYQESLAVCRRIGHLPGQARAWERFGALKVRAGETEAALSAYRQGLDLCRAHEDRVGSLFFYDHLIPLLRVLGRLDEVIRSYRESITLAEQLGDREKMALGLVGLADGYRRQGRDRDAAPCLALAHDTYVRLGKEREADLIRRELEAVDPRSR